MAIVKLCPKNVLLPKKDKNKPFDYICPECEWEGSDTEVKYDV